ncbi:hypothetical protein G153_10048 [Megasphaera sp. BL7]|jgi:hypothetical protein|nr:hypothetical protein NM10_10933 [Megasphaera sp. NM10]EPP15442.1 hypothetical protein G153_10048 [Megasphaera sp. BL7]
MKSPSFLIPFIIAEIGRDTSNNEKEIENKRNAKKIIILSKMGIVIEYFAGKNCNYFIFLYNRIVIEE